VWAFNWSVAVSVLTVQIFILSILTNYLFPWDIKKTETQKKITLILKNYYKLAKWHRKVNSLPPVNGMRKKCHK